MRDLLTDYIQDADNPEKNFALAVRYHDLGQTASAVSFYLRAAERTHDDLLKYECLVRASMCFDSQGSRGLSVRGLLQHAMSICPKRPEAYYLLSRYYERDAGSHPHTDPSVEEWFHGYTFASVGLQVCDFDAPPLRTQIDFPGRYGLLFEKGVCAWWCGLCNESKDIMVDLYHNWTDANEVHRNAIIRNLDHLQVDPNEPTSLNRPSLNQYKKDDGDKFSFLFLNQEKIYKNYSEAYQDIFVLGVLNGKQNGTYLEIGAGDPTYGSNTFLLEKNFDWTGIGLDIEPQFVEWHRQYRKNKVLQKNAIDIDYLSLLAEIGRNGTVDYLQIDCDPPEISYEVLKKIPFDVWKFAVITYEHDYYCDETKTYRDKSREYLRSKGYVLVAPNISPDDDRSYEDWWVHPELVDQATIDRFTISDSQVNNAQKYLVKKLRGGAPDWFDWGEIKENEWFYNMLQQEIFHDNIYQRFFEVEQGDTVLDVGASVGVFAYAASLGNPSRIVCLEPQPSLFQTLKSNVGNIPVKVDCINRAVGASTGRNIVPGIYDKNHTEMWGNPSDADTISFADLIQQHGIQTIDFLKSDCEGGEYDIFSEENYDWIMQNVKKVAGEWHLHNDELKAKFRMFRDKYLRNVPNFHVYSIDHVDIKWDIWNDHFIDYYAIINLYIDNRCG